MTILSDEIFLPLQINSFQHKYILMLKLRHSDSFPLKFPQSSLVVLHDQLLHGYIGEVVEAFVDVRGTSSAYFLHIQDVF